MSSHHAASHYAGTHYESSHYGRVVEEILRFIFGSGDDGRMEDERLILEIIKAFVTRMS